MKNYSEREIGHLFGIVGGTVILLGALVAFLAGTVDLALGRLLGGADAYGEALVLAVVGGLVLLFEVLAERAWSGRPATSGLLLVALAGVGYVALGFGGNLLALLGGLLVLLAGVLYLIEPATRVASGLAYAR